jgi:DNA-3-methyladenine glycosylase
MAKTREKKKAKPARTKANPLPSLPPVTLAQLRADRLPRSFYARDVAEVARALVGCAIVHRERAAVIVETEAYGGPDDLASHARFGPTARNAAMFGPPGHAYVYLCYGTHQMFNISTGTDGIASAVLIRATAPLLGTALDAAIGRGPGKLTAALGIDRSLDRLDLIAAGSPLWLAALPHVPGATIALAVGPRVGVDYAGPWAELPLRFAWRGHPCVSRPAPSTPWP